MCHSLYMPEAYSPAQWKSVMGGMASADPYVGFRNSIGNQVRFDG